MIGIGNDGINTFWVGFSHRIYDIWKFMEDFFSVKLTGHTKDMAKKCLGVTYVLRDIVPAL
jgi:hypothetical protein